MEEHKRSSNHFCKLCLELPKRASDRFWFFQLIVKVIGWIEVEELATLLAVDAPSGEPRPIIRSRKLPSQDSEMEPFLKYIRNTVKESNLVSTSTFVLFILWRLFFLKLFFFLWKMALYPVTLFESCESWLRLVLIFWWDGRSSKRNQI